MCDLADRPSLYEQAPARRTGASDLAPYAQARTFLTDTYARRRNAVDCSVVDSAGTPPVPPTTVPCARQGLGIMQAWMQTERSRNWAHRVSLLAPGAAFLGEHHAVARLCRDVLPHVHHPVSMHSILLGVPPGLPTQLQARLPPPRNTSCWDAPKAQWRCPRLNRLAFRGASCAVGALCHSPRGGRASFQVLERRAWDREDEASQKKKGSVLPYPESRNAQCICDFRSPAYL